MTQVEDTTTDSSRPGCESCGMPIESGRYCAHCTGADGSLQPFEERFERMVAWQARRDPAASREQLEAATRAYMATMPAWRAHPALAPADRALQQHQDADHEERQDRRDDEGPQAAESVGEEEEH